MHTKLICDSLEEVTAYIKTHSQTTQTDRELGLR